MANDGRYANYVFAKFLGRSLVQGGATVLTRAGSAAEFFTSTLASQSGTNGPFAVWSTTLAASNAVVTFAVRNAWATGSNAPGGAWSVNCISPGGWIRFGATASCANVGSYVIMAELRQVY